MVVRLVRIPYAVVGQCLGGRGHFCQGMLYKLSTWYSTLVLLSRPDLITYPHLLSHPGDELARALLPITSYFAISSILVGYFKLPISRRFIRLSLHKATIGT